MTLDHLGRELALETAPRRIVSLVPSITESLVALGAQGRLVGRTTFCIHPERELAHVPTIGGTKTPDLERVRALAPDLVLANKEENRESHVLELARTVPVFVTDVRTLAGARAFSVQLAALLRGHRVDSRHELAERPVPRPRRPRGLALVWRTPLVGVGEDTYAADVLAAAGVANVLPASAGRYPRLDAAGIVALAPELLVLPSEPHPWTLDEGRELSTDLARLGLDVRAALVPGEGLTWWGSRSERAALEIKRALAVAGVREVSA